MIKHIAYQDLGSANYGWLNTKYHFSFADYYNPNRMGFGKLRVINDDIVKSGYGFPMHPHRDMEIITYIRQGAITHEDTMGNRHKLKAGEVQIMSAGTGVLHSEYNFEQEDTILYQIWIKPNQKSIEPSWDNYEFDQKDLKNQLTLYVSGDGTAPLTMHQDAFIYGGLLDKGTELTHKIKHQAYILVADGTIQIKDSIANKGDAFEITDHTTIDIIAQQDAEILLIDVPQ